MSKQAEQFEGDYHNGLGRRKESSARVRIYPDADNKFIINNNELDEYFDLQHLKEKIMEPLEMVSKDGEFGVSVKVEGGGFTGQADAIQLGLARALVELDPELKPTLKSAGHLTRDARVKERKKYGHKGARKSPQFSKR